jgi:hypothetical protein
VRQQSGHAEYRIVVVQLLDGIEQLVHHEFVVLFVEQFVDARFLELVVVQLLIRRFKFVVAVIVVQRLADGSERR